MNRLCLIGLFLVGFGTTVPAKHFVWRVRTNDSTVYLAGSIHVLRVTDVIPATYDTAFMQSDRVVFELDLDDAASSAYDSFVLANALYPSGLTIRGALSRTAYVKLQNFAAAQGLSRTAFDRYRPWFVLGAIDNFQDSDLGFQSRYGVDRRYFTMAANYGKPRLFLETVRYQIRALSSPPDAEWAGGIEPTIDDGGYSTIDLVRGWRRGDVHSTAARVNASAVYTPNIYRSLLLERNKNWLPHIQSYLTQSSTTMVVVGAAHLVGRKGLVRMLRNRGYDVLQMPGIMASNTSLTLSYETLSGTTNVIDAALQPTGLEIPPTSVAEQTWFDLRVQAVGDGTITYDWFKDGNQFLSETNGMIHVENVTLDHAGIYSVASRNEFGSSLPASCSIMVQPPP